MPMMIDLLVSVRSAAEARAALAGGAALIDVKEPRRGSLGRADDETIAAVVRGVAGRRPVSAALGELTEQRPAPACPLAYVKWGLAGCRDQSDWAGELTRAADLLPPGCRPVAVAYADWKRAQAPPPEEVLTLAAQLRLGALLIDTWQKDGSTLLDWLPVGEIGCLGERCRTAGVPLALAGSLGLAEIRTLLPLQPDWFAVRGAVCRGRQRGAAIEEDKVRELAEAITPARTAS